MQGKERMPLRRFQKHRAVLLRRCADVGLQKGNFFPVDLLGQRTFLGNHCLEILLHQRTFRHQLRFAQHDLRKIVGRIHLIVSTAAKICHIRNIVGIEPQTYRGHHHARFPHPGQSIVKIPVAGLTVRQENDLSDTSLALGHLLIGEGQSRTVASALAGADSRDSFVK